MQNSKTVWFGVCVCVSVSICLRVGSVVESAWPPEGQETETEASHLVSQPCLHDWIPVKILDTTAWAALVGRTLHLPLHINAKNIIHWYQGCCPWLHRERTTGSLCLQLSWTLFYVYFPQLLLTCILNLEYIITISITALMILFILLANYETMGSPEGS